MPLTAIALGSNLGDRESNLLAAVQQVRALGSVTALSSFYDTAPVGVVNQPRFLNGALLLATELPPLDLLHALLATERSLGRDRTAVPAKGPRIVDLDLLVYADVAIATPELTLPHPALHQRRFVLVPLAEIAPDLKVPHLERTVAELLACLPADIP